MSKYVGKLKTGPNKTHSYLIHPECLVCNCVKPTRLIIDKYLVTHSFAETAKMILGYGVKISDQNIRTHMEKHSPYLSEIKTTVLKAAENMSLSTIDSIQEDYIEAEDVIQEIITIGGRKIRAGEMIVDAKLLLGAIKEQGTRKQQGRLRDLLEELDVKRFLPVESVEGTIIEERTS